MAMPELPEVETVRRQLEPEVRRADDRGGRGARRALDPPRAAGRGSRRRSPGARIESVGRRGKYLVVEPRRRRALVMHLRMTGNLLVRAAGLDGGRRPDGDRAARRPAPVRVRPRDPPPAGADRARRRLGALVHRRRGASATASSCAAGELDAYFASRLGVEPLGGELTPELLLELAAGRRAPLKSFLLNQERVAGIGNIYADEALFRAQLHPLSPAGSMRLEHAEELRDGIVDALEAGLAQRRLVDRRLPRRARRARLDAGRVPRPHARGRAVPALRRARSAGWSSPAARPTSAPAARRGCGRGRAGGGRGAR